MAAAVVLSSIPISLLPVAETFDIRCNPRKVPSRSNLLLRDVPVHELSGCCFKKVPVIINTAAVWVFREEHITEFPHVTLHTSNIPFLVLENIPVCFFCLLTDSPQHIKQHNGRSFQGVFPGKR